MLSWTMPSQLQTVPGYSLARVGTIGDGNCLLHSILYLASPTYRAQGPRIRAEIADEFRSLLVDRQDALREHLDLMFADVGGAAAFEESMEVLQQFQPGGPREELPIELGGAIAGLYGLNFLAVQLTEDLTLRPVAQTMRGFDMERPTLLVNYIGGGVNIGNTGFQLGGHYEAMISPVFVAPSTNRRATRKKGTTLILDEERTSFMLEPGSEPMSILLTLFGSNSNTTGNTNGTTTSGASTPSLSGGRRRRRPHPRRTRRALRKHQG
jgi:hypothetical protein